MRAETLDSQRRRFARNRCRKQNMKTSVEDDIERLPHAMLQLSVKTLPECGTGRVVRMGKV
jgi:hypothetical protein